MEKTTKRRLSIKDRIFLFFILISIGMILVYQAQSVITLLSPTPTVQRITTPRTYLEIAVEDEDMVVFTTPTPLPTRAP